MYRIDTRTTQTRAPQLPQTSRNTNPRVSTSTGVIHKTSVSRPQLKNTQMKDKVVQNNSQVKSKKTKVEDHHRVSSISNKTKSVTACNDSLKSRTSNVNVVYATCGKCVFNSNHDACVSKFINDVNARTKKPKVVPIRSNLSNVPSSSNSLVDCATNSYYCWTLNDNMAYDWKPKLLGIFSRNITIKRVYYVEGLNHNLFSVGQFCDVNLKVAFRKSTFFVRDLQGNDLLIVLCSKNTSLQAIKVCQSLPLSDNSIKQNTQPTTNIQPTTKPITPTTNVKAEENNIDQAADAHIDENEFYNIFSTPVREEAEPSTRYVDNSNMHTFYQRHQSEHRWTKDHPLEQVRGNPSKPVQTRRQLATDPETCMFALTAKYALEILKKHGMDKCDIIGTPLATKPKLDVDLSGKPVDQTNYHSMIGSLMYLTSSRPDLVQAVYYCARYQARPTEKHLKEVKRIFRYLKGTINMGLWYPKYSGFELTAFSDADHVGCIDTRKSTSGDTVPSCAQVIWMRTHLKDYGFDYNKIPLYCDSQSAIAISCNPVQHSRTKYIHTRYHFIKEQVERGIIELHFVRTEYQLADMFTKALPEDIFQYLVRRIGMRCLTPAKLEVLENESA
ncbi:hypothetical protein Tco_0200600 [Tanacetum coccineum]